MPKKKTKKRINTGTFANDVYIKHVSLTKAVLWKDRELSLPKYIMAGFNAHSTKTVVFIDKKKGEKWIFPVEMIEDFGVWKIVGQEEQWYFPIGMAKVKKLTKPQRSAVSLLEAEEILK